MDYYCFESECKNLATFECSCPNKFIICANHIANHMKKFKCATRNIEDKIYTMKVISTKNALNNLILDVTLMGELMISEISRVIKENIAYIERKKRLLYGSVVPSEYIEKTIKWAKGIDIKNRSRTLLNLNILYLLNIKGDSENIESKIKSELSYIECGKKYSQACETIKRLENLLNDNNGKSKGKNKETIKLSAKEEFYSNLE